MRRELSGREDSCIWAQQRCEVYRVRVAVYAWRWEFQLGIPILTVWRSLQQRLSSPTKHNFYCHEPHSHHGCRYNNDPRSSLLHPRQQPRLSHLAPRSEPRQTTSALFCSRLKYHHIICFTVKYYNSICSGFKYYKFIYFGFVYYKFICFGF